DVSRNARAVEGRSDAQPIELEPPFVGPAPGTAEDDHLWNHLGIGCGARERAGARHQREETPVRSSGRNRVEELAANHLLTPDALHVDDWRLAADRDRFSDGSDGQFGVDRRDERATELNSFALERAETRKAERDRIGTAAQIDDTVEAGAVGHGRSD